MSSLARDAILRLLKWRAENDRLDVALEPNDGREGTFRRLTYLGKGVDLGQPERLDRGRGGSSAEVLSVARPAEGNRRDDHAGGGAAEAPDRRQQPAGPRPGAT